MDSCDHPFCLQCIRNWRATYDKKMKKQHFRTCPICRKNSYLVIPSEYYVKSGPDKEDLIDEYKEWLGGIPCKLFNKGDGECPFKDSCFYRHETKDGELFEYGWVDTKNKFINGEWVEDTEQTLADRFDVNL